MLNRRGLLAGLAGVPVLGWFFSSSAKADFIRQSFPTLQIPQEDGSVLCIPLTDNKEIHIFNNILNDMWDKKVMRFRKNFNCDTIIIRDGKVVDNTYEKSQ